MTNALNVSVANYHLLQLIRKCLFFLLFASGKPKELGKTFCDLTPYPLAPLGFYE